MWGGAWIDHHCPNRKGWQISGDIVPGDSAVHCPKYLEGRSRIRHDCFGRIHGIRRNAAWLNVAWRRRNWAGNPGGTRTRQDVVTAPDRSIAESHPNHIRVALGHINRCGRNASRERMNARKRGCIVFALIERIADGSVGDTSVWIEISRRRRGWQCCACLPCLAVSRRHVRVTTRDGVLGIAWIHGDTVAISTISKVPWRSSARRHMRANAEVLSSAIAIGIVGGSSATDIDLPKQDGGECTVRPGAGVPAIQDLPACTSVAAAAQPAIRPHIEAHRTLSASVGRRAKDDGMHVCMELVETNTIPCGQPGVETVV